VLFQRVTPFVMFFTTTNLLQYLVFHTVLMFYISNGLKQLVWYEIHFLCTTPNFSYSTCSGMDSNGMKT
jgi:hypothetical protein